MNKVHNNINVDKNVFKLKCWGRFFVISHPQNND